MNNKQLSNSLENVNDKFINEAMEKRAPKKVLIYRIAAAAACFALILAVGIFALGNRNNIPLSDASKGVKASYSDKGADVNQSYSLIALTEEELFTYFDTVIFKGVIEKIDNITLDFNGEKIYRALAQIKVERVIRGEFKAGDTLTILLPSGVSDGIRVTDTEITASFKVGQTGIFMPTVYTTDSYFETNGAKLLLTDVASYGFSDGMRYAFIETDSGILFDTSAYKSIAGVQTLDEIEVYINSMI